MGTSASLCCLDVLLLPHAAGGRCCTPCQMLPKAMCDVILLTLYWRSCMTFSTSELATSCDTAKTCHPGMLLSFFPMEPAFNQFHFVWQHELGAMMQSVGSHVLVCLHTHAYVQVRAHHRWQCGWAQGRQQANGKSARAVPNL
jgi:hypothetical protein